MADLGLAEKIPTTPEDMARLSMVGTPYIMAPEVLHGKPYNETVILLRFIYFGRENVTCISVKG